ncbi:MAG TPA: hypothetical protein PLQ93_11165 [Bacteroidia bacterium]|nr:hypothetical protein [Bacteroidia bacterium]
MRHFLIAVVCLSLGKTMHSQEESRPFEFGSTLFTLNSLSPSKYALQYRAPLEIMNGLFFRYHYGRMALRFTTSYSENHSAYEPAPYSADGMGGEEYHKDFRIGAGVQYQLSKKRKWLYAFSDLSYRNLFTEGSSYGGFSGTSLSYYSTSNGIDWYFGLGFALKLMKNVFLSPEQGYLMYMGFENRTNRSFKSASEYSTQYTNINLSTIAKLHCSVRF